MTIDSHSLILAAGVGMLSGTDTAIWGMYKDAIHEGFSRGRFARSIVVGAIAGVLMQLVFALPLPGAAALVMLFGLAYAGERAIVEVWKTFVREEDQSKYTIPMRFSIRGVPVESRSVRLLAGGAYSALVLVGALGVARFDAGDSRIDTTIVALLGLAVGLVIAFGGAWKDAPTEGFDSAKFLKSPCLTIAFALLLSRLSSSYLEIVVATVGYERLASETYKTFLFPSRPRGKFAGKPILHPDMLRRRRRFVPAYLVIRAALLMTVAAAFREVSNNRPDRSDRAATPGAGR